MHKTILRTLSVVLATALTTTASAAIISTDADTLIRRGEATTNFGNSTTLFVKNNDTVATGNSTDRVTVFRFDLSAAEPTITDAILRLTRTASATGGSAGTFQVFGIPDLAAGENFIEGNGGTDNAPAGELRFDNAPFVDTSDNSVIDANLTLLGTFTSPPDASLAPTIDFTDPALVTFLNNDTNNIAAFVITLSSNNTGFVPQFVSKEGNVATAPTLLTNAAVPEPSTVAMLVLGTLGMLTIRRRVR